MEKPITSLAVVKGMKGVESHEGGAISFNGPDAVNLYRLTMIKSGLEMEMRGMRLTAKAPPCFKIIAKEFGIKVKRSPEGKRAAYEAFCAMHGFTPRLMVRVGNLGADKEVK